jgi:hypothetical protein
MLGVRRRRSQRGTTVRVQHVGIIRPYNTLSEETLHSAAAEAGTKMQSRLRKKDLNRVGPVKRNPATSTSREAGLEVARVEEVSMELQMTEIQLPGGDASSRTAATA